MTRAAPNPRRKLQPTTWFGRHEAAMVFIAEKFKNRGDSVRVVAWAVGIGGHQGNGTGLLPITPTEHLEVAFALKKAGVVDFCIYALESSEQSILLAQRQIQTGIVTSVRTGHPFFPQTPKGFDLVLPPGLCKKIVLCGPNESGDVFVTDPPELPDIITIFNVARSYQRRHQVRLARRLAEALRHDGVLLTNQTVNQTVFVRTLKENLGDKIDLGPCIETGRSGRIVAFQKNSSSK